LSLSQFGARLAIDSSVPSKKGFTVIELMVVIAIVGIVAAAAVISSRSAMSNASLSSATFDVALKLSGLRAAALAEARDYLFVGVDASDPTNCKWNNTSVCAQGFILAADRTSAPLPLQSSSLSGWTLSTFDPTAPVDSTVVTKRSELIQQFFLPTGVRFDLTNATAIPSPFNSVFMYDGLITGNCAGRRCFAIHFNSVGVVTAKPAVAGTTINRGGFAFALDTILTGSASTAARQGVLVGFPSGIVKSFYAGG
jgi:prepilin-type N-terminal cleavage/methylation domain-containing protein